MKTWGENITGKFRLKSEFWKHRRLFHILAQIDLLIPLFIKSEVDKVSIIHSQKICGLAFL